MSESYRDKCLESKGHHCHICDADDYIVVHHIDGNQDNNSLENLIPVCRSCHSRIHSGGDGLERWTDELPPSALAGDEARNTPDNCYELGEGEFDFSFEGIASTTESFEVSSFKWVRHGDSHTIEFVVDG